MSKSTLQNSSPNFKILDGLRGIAALYVVINHCRGNMLIGGSEFAQTVPVSEWSLATKAYFGSLQLTSLGTEFVILFFVLSGFSIAHSLKSNHQVIAFYKRRLVRLYLPYILALLWAYIAFLFCTQEPAIPNLSTSVFHDWSTGVKNLIYIPTGDLIPQFWSLTHEVIFYFLAPFILLKPRLKFFYILPAIGYLFYAGFGNQFIPHSILGDFLFKYSAFFALGVFLYHNYKTLPFIQKLIGKAQLYVGSISLFLAMVVVKFVLGEDNSITPVLSSLLSVLLIVNFLHFSIQTKWLSFIGKMSYSLYITHFATIYFTLQVFNHVGLINDHTTSKWYVWILGIFICVLVTIPFYVFGEKPTKKILARMRKPQKP